MTEDEALEQELNQAGDLVESMRNFVRLLAPDDLTPINVIMLKRAQRVLGDLLSLSDEMDTDWIH